jgi:hypothetical protein
MPISFPSNVTRAPPLFPGLTAASVCMKDSMAPCSRVCLYFLLWHLQFPVTVDARLNGFPTATTHSPISMVSLSPNSIKERFFHQSLELNLWVGHYPPVLRCKNVHQTSMLCWFRGTTIVGYIRHVNSTPEALPTIGIELFSDELGAEIYIVWIKDRFEKLF